MLFGLQAGAYSAGSNSSAAYFNTLPSIGSGGASGASGTGVRPLLAYDASQLTGANGSFVTSVPDQAGHAAAALTNVSNDLATYAPVLVVNNTGGKNTVHFNGVSKALHAANIANILSGLATGSYTILHTISFTSYGNGQTFALTDVVGTTDAGDNTYTIDNTLQATRYVNRSFATNVTVPSGAGATGVVYVKILRCDVSAGSLKYDVNGSSVSSALNGAANAEFNNLNLNFIGDYTAGNGSDHYFGECVIWNAAATDAQVASLNTQQHAKWG